MSKDRENPLLNGADELRRTLKLGFLMSGGERVDLGPESKKSMLLVVEEGLAASATAPRDYFVEATDVESDARTGQGLKPDQFSPV